VTEEKEDQEASSSIKAMCSWWEIVRNN